MGRTVNLIPEASSTFFESTDPWIITGGTYVIEPNQYAVQGYNSVKITPTNSSTDVVLSISDIPTALINEGDTVEFHARVKVDAAAEVTIDVINNNNDATQHISNAYISAWSVCRSRSLTVPVTGSPNTFSIAVTISNHNGEQILFNAPFAFITMNIFRDEFLLEVFQTLPQYIQEADIATIADDELPNYPVSRLMELTTPLAGDAVADYFDFEYLDLSGGKDETNPLTLSELVDPIVVRRNYVEWLSQFAGVQVNSPPIGATPWGNLLPTWSGLQEDIDLGVNTTAVPTVVTRSANVVTATIPSSSFPNNVYVSLQGFSSVGKDFNGAFLLTNAFSTSLTWNQVGPDESATVLGTITEIDTEWEEIEAFNPNENDLVEYLRWQIKYAYNGINGGTTNALLDSVKRPLTLTKTANIYVRYLDDPWKILVVTKTSETPQGVENYSSPVIESYIAEAKPAGYQVTHVCTSTGVQ